MRLISRFFLVLTVGVVASLAALPQSLAQNVPTQEETVDLNSVMNTLSKLPTKIREELMSEADQVKYTCEKKVFYSSFHDCDCISLNFLSRRITEGPEPNQGVMMFEISKRCVNKTGAAGYSYNYCLNAMLPFKGKIGAACTCVARSMVKAYERDPNPDVNYVRALYMNGIESCKIQNYITAPLEEFQEQQKNASSSNVPAPKESP